MRIEKGPLPIAEVEAPVAGFLGGAPVAVAGIRHPLSLGHIKDALVTKLTGQQYIKISNETDTELIVLITEDPKALVLTKKTVTVVAGVDAGAALGANASVEAEYEYELNTGNAITQEIHARTRPKVGGQSVLVKISASAYVTVILFKDDVYKFIIARQKLDVADKLIIEQADLQSNSPFNFSRTKPAGSRVPP